MNFFLHFTKFNLLIHYLLLLLLSISLLHLIIILLDGLYRPNNAQYPANRFLDIFLPLIFILSPLSLFFTSNFLNFDFLELKWLERLFFIICLYSFFILPIIYLWSKHRNWDTILIKNKWTHPHIFLHIAVSLLYPLIWLIYFNLIKYLRLGNSLNLGNIFNIEYFGFFIILLFLWPYTSIWLRLIIWSFLNIRHLLWKELMILLHSIHIILLKSKIYFKFMEYLYKISYLFISYVTINSLLYLTPTFLQKIIRKLYFYPIIINSFIIMIIFTELFFTKGFLYYSLYILLITAITRSIIYFLGNFNGPANSWIEICCISNYRYLKWEKSYYPVNFWLSFYDIRSQHNNLPEIDENTKLNIDSKIEQYKNLNKKTRNYNLYRLQKYYSKKFTGYKNRLKLSYNHWTQIRWVHTQAFQAVNKWHPLTAYFVRNLYDKLALINNNWTFYHTLEKFESKNKYLTDYCDLNIYSNFKFTSPGNPKHHIKISAVIENNLITNFNPMKFAYNVEVITFNSHILLDSKSQSKPDAISDFRNATLLQDKRVHGMDQKATKNTSEPASKIYSEMSPRLYEQALDIFSQEFQYNNTISSAMTIQILKALNKLAQSSEDLNLHQKIWAENLHLLPPNYIPPMRIPSNICLNDFTAEALNIFEKRNIRMEKISNFLKFHKIGDNDYVCAIEIFEGADIQKIYGN